MENLSQALLSAASPFSVAQSLEVAKLMRYVASVFAGGLARVNLENLSQVLLPAASHRSVAQSLEVAKPGRQVAGVLAGRLVSTDLEKKQHISQAALAQIMNVPWICLPDPNVLRGCQANLARRLKPGPLP